MVEWKGQSYVDIDCKQCLRDYGSCHFDAITATKYL